MSNSFGQRSPGYRGRLILRQLAEPPRSVPRPHFRSRGATPLANELPGARATDTQATSDTPLPVAAVRHI